MLNPDNAPTRKTAYAEKLMAMNDRELFQETKDKVWLSAYASNNPHSCFHWQCDYTYKEWVRRHGNGDQYDKAHKAVVRETCG